MKLASNENPRGPGPRVREAIAAAARDLNRYPDGNGYALKHALAARLGHSPDAIVLGNGSNDVLELVTQAFLRPGDHAVWSQHAFIVYPLATQARGAHRHRGPGEGLRTRPGRDARRDHAAHADRVRRQSEQSRREPGSRPPPSRPSSMRCPRDVLVVLDEAYNEFLEPCDQSDAVDWVATLSAPDRVADILQGPRSRRAAHRLRRDGRVGGRPAEPCAPAIQRQLAGAGGGDRGARGHRLRRREPARSIAKACACSRPGSPVTGCAGCRRTATSCWCRSATRRASTNCCCAQGVIVRPVANYGLPEWLRVTVGLPRENERFLAALAQALDVAADVASGANR